MFTLAPAEAWRVWYQVIKCGAALPEAHGEAAMHLAAASSAAAATHCPRPIVSAVTATFIVTMRRCRCANVHIRAAHARAHACAVQFFAAHAMDSVACQGGAVDSTTAAMAALEYAVAQAAAFPCMRTCWRATTTVASRTRACTPPHVRAHFTCLQSKP